MAKRAKETERDGEKEERERKRKREKHERICPNFARSIMKSLRGAPPLYSLREKNARTHARSRKKGLLKYLGYLYAYFGSIDRVMRTQKCDFYPR